MHSRAFLLLQRDLENLRRFPMEGVSAGPRNDLNLFYWEAKLHGLPNTPWEGGVFHIHLKFSGEFNTVPPIINFMTIPFHPNIDPDDGRPHCHLLSVSGWSEVVTVSILLISLQSLISSPETQYTVNTAAAHLLHTAPHTYHQMANDCVSASLRIDAGLPPYDYEEERDEICTTQSLPQSPKLPSLQTHSVSFDDYLSLWRGIATSTATSTAPFSSPNNKKVRSTADRQLKSSSSRGTLLDQKLKQHHLQQHGQGGHELSRSAVREQRINRLKLTFEMREEEEEEQEEEEVEEEEVDQILHWTKGLNDTLISTPHTPL